MKCEKCNAEFTVKEQAKSKGCCPSCGEKLPASACRDDAKAWRWYQYHSPMPLSMILACIYLVGGGLLVLLILLESVNLRLWDVTSPAGWLAVITAALIFLRPFFVLFFMPSARGWRAELRGDGLVHKAADKKCKICNSEFPLWMLAWKKGCCPSCGEKIPVSEYCHGVPDRRWWRLFRGAPLGLKLSAICLVLFGCWVVFDNLYLIEFPIGMGVFLLILFHMLKSAVRGSVPYGCIMVLGVLGWGAADSFREFLVVLVLLALLLLSCLTPAARCWGRKIREEDLSYWIAVRSGAFLFRRMVVKYILKKMVMVVLLIACLGLCAYYSESIERMRFWLRSQWHCLQSDGV